MRRIGLIVAGTAAAVVLGGMVWLVLEVARLEAQEQQARALAQHEERVRLALWRLDSALSVVLAAENARASVGGFDGALPDTTTPLVRRRFELPTRSGARLDASGDGPSVVEILAALEQAPGLSEPEDSEPEDRAAGDTEPPLPERTDRPLDLEAQNQARLNSNEFVLREQIANQQILGPQSIDAQLAELQREAERLEAREASARGVAALRPLWIDDQLVLARRAERRGIEVLQGLVLDVDATRGWLLDQVRDLLPAADLVPTPPTAEADPGRQLALLPWRLVPGPAPPPQAAQSSLRGGLVLGASAIAIALFALVLVGAASLHLARRRGDFAAAVVHELRTPLTTFRLYTDLLAEGQVPPAQQPGYFETLRQEADRLGHLVENVLAYARLENTRGPRPDALELAPWLAATLPELERQATAAGFRLTTRIDAANARVVADGVGLERILHNLCSNSLRHAAGGEHLELSVGIDGDHALIEWSDDGPGMDRGAWRRLVRPFHRERRESHDGAGGLGLGLALSRQLARRWGGDLRLVETGGGAGLTLRLRLRLATARPARTDG